MNALILTPYAEHPVSELIKKEEYSMLLCADTAAQLASELGLFPDIILGDFDHAGEPPTGKNVHRFPCEKDDTDTMLCLKYAIEQGATHVTILGGIGGRLDHTIANLQALAYATEHDVSARLTDGANEAMLIKSCIRLPRADGYYLSVFAYGGMAEGVSLRGVKYPLENGTLSPAFPLGVSNEFVEDEAEITVQGGLLLIILSKKEASK